MTNKDTIQSQLEDKLQDEFMQFWDEHKDTLGLGNYSDEVKRFWLEKIKQAEQRGADAERERIVEEMHEIFPVPDMNHAEMLPRDEQMKWANFGTVMVKLQEVANKN